MRPTDHFLLRETMQHCATTRWKPILAIAALMFLSACGSSGSTTLIGTSGLSTTTHQVSGSISGLTAKGLVLSIGGADLTVEANATSFAFPSGIAVGASYAILVTTQPTGQTCTVSGGSGTVGTANVANVVVTCAENAYALGGSVSGLTSSDLVLTDGTDTLTVPANATMFTFPDAVAYGASYAVTVSAQPTGLACAVTHGSGVMPASAVISVSVSCTDQSFTLSVGSINGLDSAGLSLALNGGTPLTVPASATSVSFPTGVAYGASYAITVSSQPTGLTCTVSNGAGTMPAGNLSNVSVVCAANAYSVSGSIGGLTASGLVLSNGSDTSSVNTGATTFALPTPVAYGAAYAVVVSSQPTGLTCTVSNGAGIMPAAPVTGVAVTCATTTYTLGGTISGVSSGGLVLANSSDTLAVLANATVFTMPLGLAPGATYNITVQAHPAGQVCTVSNGSGTMSSNDVTTVAVACVTGSAASLYSFGVDMDGQNPFGSLIQASDGNLYGLTDDGGANGAGAVIKVTLPAGTESVLYSFGSSIDGQNPFGSLVQASDGNFYGMTIRGGTNGLGTVFKITPAGVETVLWSFGSGSDAQSPFGTLIQASDGNLYGITNGGGTSGFGTVFKITLAGVETVLHSFSAGNDGQYAEGSLLQASDGNLYGMTDSGGTNNTGTVFEITLPGGTESVLYSFGSGTDGQVPEGSLMQASDGNLYGMTNAGGASDKGAVIKITLGGTESVLYSFGAGPDGQFPYGSLIQASGGDLYGMTTGGGASGVGTVVKITLTGVESVLHSFAGSDGEYPYYGDLIQASDGNLYGLVAYGGANGGGTIFSIN